MKLYSGPLSLFTGKVRIALAEKGLDYQLESVPFSRAGYQPKHPVVLAVNPKAQVPVLEDGELLLYDSTIIFEYLEDRYPQPPLYPADAVARARCRQLEAAADEVLFPSIFELITEIFYKPDAKTRDAARIGRAAESITRHYDGLEASLGDRQWLGPIFSVADIGYFMTITFASSLGAGLGDAHSQLRGWYDRVLARPSVTAEVTGLTAAMSALS